MITELYHGAVIQLPIPFADMKEKILSEDIEMGFILKQSIIAGIFPDINDMSPYRLSECAYYWARYIGDHDIMRPLITDPQWTHEWERSFGDRDIMCLSLKIE